MALRRAVCNRAGGGDDDSMSVIEERTVTTREPSGVLDNSEDERYVALMAKASDAATSATITLGVAKGWRFRCKSGDQVDLWAPVKHDGTAMTYSLRSAALWRAIKKRGVSLK